MNIVIVNGSPRTNGSTGKILGKIQEHLSEKAGTTVKQFNLSEYDMKFCKGCMLCYRTGRCIINDGINEVADEIRKADAVVFGSPTYASNVSGQFKTFIDRSGFVFGQLLHDKYGFAVGTYENAAGNQAIKVLNRLFLFSGASRKGKFLIKLNYNSNPFKEQKYLRNLLKKVDKFYNAIKIHKSKSLTEKIVNWAVVNIVIKPRILRHEERYSGIIKRLKELSII